MDHFPVINSTISPLHLGLFIQEQFHFEAKIFCHLIKTWVNDTYLIIHQSEKYIFRIYRLNWRSHLEIEEELRFINTLKAKELSVSSPIKDKSGNFIQTIPAPEGERLGVLFSYAQGDKKLTIPPNLHLRIGQLMGKIHLTSQDLFLKRISYNFENLISTPLIKIEEILGIDEIEFQLLKQYQISILNSEAIKNIDKLRTGVVHLDIWADNLNITKNNDITLFDFDFCGNGWLALDIAYHLVMIFLFESDQNILEEKSKSFLQGYKSQNTIFQEEKELIPHLGTTILIFYLGFQCERFSSLYVNKTYVKGFINSRIKRWVNHHLPK